MVRLEVLNPVAQVAPQKASPAARPPDLTGKTVGLYWNMKAGGDIALARVRELLAGRYPGLTFREYTGSVGFLMRHATPEDAARIAGECQVVVGTTGD
jgi:hypothetical protein